MNVEGINNLGFSISPFLPLFLSAHMCGCHANHPHKDIVSDGEKQSVEKVRDVLRMRAMCHAHWVANYLYGSKNKELRVCVCHVLPLLTLRMKVQRQGANKSQAYMTAQPPDTQ